MFSKTVLVAGLAAIANLAVASPIQENSALHERGAIQAQDTPGYCHIIGNERAALSYFYVDVSKECQDAGLGDNCCLTIRGQGPNHPWTEQDRADLMSVVAKQSKKDGKFQHTTVGVWTASYELFTSEDLVDSQLLQIWFHTIQDINLAATSGYGDVVLQIFQGTDSVSNYMYITKNG